jgi:hypothetical protein
VNCLGRSLLFSRPSSGCGHRCAGPGPDRVGRDCQLAAGIAHGVEIYQLAALDLALLGGDQARVPDREQGRHVLGGPACGVEVRPGVQRHVHVQALPAGGLQEGGQAEFALEQFPQHQRGGPHVAEPIRIGWVQVEDQLVRIADPAKSASTEIRPARTVCVVRVSLSAAASPGSPTPDPCPGAGPDTAGDAAGQRWSTR